MDLRQEFKVRMSNWWRKFLSYWKWLLAGEIILLIVGILLQDVIVSVLDFVNNLIFSDANNFLNWGINSPISLVLIFALIYIFFFFLIAFLESMDERGINLLAGESGDMLEIIVENQTGVDLFRCKTILDDVFFEDESIFKKEGVDILPHEDSLVWKDSEVDDIDIFNEETAIISLARYDESQDVSFLITSAGEVALPKGICKARVKLLTESQRGKKKTLIFWVYIQFGLEEELEIEETGVSKK